VLPDAITARLAVEAGVTSLWYRHVGTAGRVIGLDTYGESAPAGDVFEHFGITESAVADALRDMIA
jgi:transketolase